MTADPLFARALALQASGDDEAAKQAYLELLQRDAAHLGALTNLGALLAHGNHRSAALVAYRQAAAAHPGSAGARVNYANALFDARDFVSAKAEYAVALVLEPDCLPAHQGLSLALDRLDERDAARRHRDIGFGGQPSIELAYRGKAPPIRALLLLNSRGGNVHAERFLDDRVFAVTNIFTDYYDGPLPKHAFVFNAIGDAELGAQALDGARALLQQTNAPVINAPGAVARTGRAENARRLRDIPGVATPLAAEYPRQRLLEKDAGRTLAADGFTFPLLVRSPGFHTGLHFVKVDAPADLADAVARLPGDALTALAFLDASGHDGLVRKFRVIIAGGVLYPLHLAISDDWKVHYFSAAMAEHAERRAEDAAFLDTMPAILGARAVAGLEGIRDALGLDYAGIDFGLDRTGNVLVFEANATMIVPAPNAEPRFAYRTPALQRIDDAVRAMLLKAAHRRDRT